MEHKVNLDIQDISNSIYMTFRNWQEGRWFQIKKNMSRMSNKILPYNTSSTFENIDFVNSKINNGLFFCPDYCRFSINDVF